MCAALHVISRPLRATHWHRLHLVLFSPSFFFILFSLSASQPVLLTCDEMFRLPEAKNACTHAQHNTPSPSLTGGIYRELKGAKEGSVTACVCVYKRHSGAVLICCTEDIICDKTETQQKFAGRETARKGGSELSDACPLTLRPEI